MSSNYTQFYRDHLALPDNHKAETLVTCIFHDDNKPSLSVNSETGLFKCHTPSCEASGGGNAYSFYALVNKEDDMTYDEAKAYVDEKYGTKVKAKKARKIKVAKDFPITMEEIEAKHQTLLSKPLVMEKVYAMGWSEEVIKKFQIGFCPPRIWIPIKEGSKVVNIRRYARNPPDGNKVISIAGFGEARLWPLEALDKETIYLFEGEKDCLLAYSLGLDAMTVTGGAGTFHMKWARLFEDRKVVVCYDVDDAGQKGAAMVSQYLIRSAKEVKVIHLPIKEPDNADFSDYILAGGTRDTFLALVERTEPVERVKDSRVSSDITEVSISNAVEKKLFYHRIKSKMRVVSKMETPLLLPGVLNFTCTRAFGNACYSCENNATGVTTVHLDEKSGATLRLLTSSVKESKSLYKEIFKVPRQCTQYQVLETDHQYVEDVLSSPVVEECSKRDMFRQRFEEHQMFILNTALDVNTDYDIESVMFEHPIDRRIVHLVYRIAPCQSTLENMELDDATLKTLERFQQNESHTSEVGGHTRGHIEQRNEDTGQA